MLSLSQQGLPILVNSPLSSINKSILTAKTPAGLPLRLPVSSLRRNLRKGLAVTHPEVGGLRIKLIFNKNVIKPGDNIKYIKEAIDAIVILHIK